MSTVLASGASDRYGDWMINMVGSAQVNSDIFDRIVLFDLGLTPFQRRLASSIRGVELQSIPPFSPHWREGRTWKTWIWTHLRASRIVWLDAGVTVLRSLEPVVRQVVDHGYFVVSQGVLVADCTPEDYYSRFSFPRELGAQLAIAAGIIGFSTDGTFFESVIKPTYESALRGFSVGFSPTEVSKLNRGLDRSETPIIRDCKLFRHEQTLLNIHFYKATCDPVVNELDRFAGWRSPHDHPEQVIWSHRRRGDLRYMPRARYHWRSAPIGQGYGWWNRVNWWRVNHSWLFRPAAYGRQLARAFRFPR